jgi:exopolysaccharide production protein ExoQ
MSAFGDTVPHSLRDWSSRAEKLFVLLALILFSQALLNRLFIPETADEGPVWLRAIWLPIYAMTIIVLIPVLLRFVHISARAFILWIPVIIVLISPLWADDPGLAARRGFALAMTTAFALYLACRFNWAELIELLAIVFAIFVVGCFIAVLVDPTFGIMQSIHPGAWRGIWDEKNTLGAHMARGALIFLCAAMMDRRRRILWWSFGLASVVLLLLSTSKTALLALILGVCAMAFIAIVRTGQAATLLIVYCALGAIGLIGTGLFFFPDDFFALLGRDATLTGRTDIWQASLNVTAERPWLGYGYDIFWVLESPQRDYINQIATWEVTNAHNGWIETALSVGWPMAALIGLTIVAALLAALSRLGRGLEAYLVFPMLLLMLLYSMSESIFIQRHNLLWIIFLVVAAKLFVGERHGEPTAMGSSRWHQS